MTKLTLLVFRFSNSEEEVSGISALPVGVADDPSPVHAALCKFDFEPTPLMWNAETEQSHN